MVLQDASSLRQAAVKAHVYGPVTLGSAATSNQHIATVEHPVDAAWPGNDTTGQPDSRSARAGGRVCVEVPAEVLQGVLLSCDHH